MGGSYNFYNKKIGYKIFLKNIILIEIEYTVIWKEIYLNVNNGLGMINIPTLALSCIYELFKMSQYFVT